MFPFCALVLRTPLANMFFISEKHSPLSWVDFGLCCNFWHFYCAMLCCVSESAGMSLRTADSVSSRRLCCSYFELGLCLDL